MVRLCDGEDELIKSVDLCGFNPIWLDYQPNSLAWPLMSERVKLLIEKNLTGTEQLTWVSENLLYT